MNYNALIENRKSVREFRGEPVPAGILTDLRTYYQTGCQRLLPELETELTILGADAQQALEGAAGYQDFLVGAPNYLVLQSKAHPHAVENAGYMLEDLVLKLQDLGLDSCWVSFADGEKVRDALHLAEAEPVVGILAFGYGKKTAKKLRVNILSMSKVDVAAQRQYYSHKKDINEIAFVDEVGKTEGLEELMGFYDDMLWQSFYAAAQAPSYLNRQPYSFVLRGKDLVLVRMADAYTDDVSAKLNLGIVMLHFGMVAGQWVGKVKWDLDAASDLKLREGCSVAAVYHM